MKKKNKKKLKNYGLIGLVLIGIFLVFYLGVGQTALTQSEIGWTPVAQNVEGYSEQGLGVIWSAGCRDGNDGTSCQKRFDSKYWSLYSSGPYDNSGSAFWLEAPQPIYEERTGDYTFTYPLASPYKLDGGDNYLKMVVVHNGGVVITYNEDLKDKYFRVNYDSDYTFTNPGRSSSLPPILPMRIMGHEIPTGSSGLVEIKPSLFEEGKAELYINGEKKEDLTYPYKLKAVVRGVDGTNWQQGYMTYFEFKNPRYNELFDCSIDNDEVLVFDEFASGSLFDINSLTYTEPLPKFCPNSQPVIVRSFTERGLTTDYNNEVFQALASGDSFRVPEDQTIRVPYVTKDTTGELRCPTNQAYNTKTESCQDILSEGIEEDYTSYTTDISLGENEILYTMNYNSLTPIIIGDLSFQTSAQRFVCECEEGRTTPPNPSNSCWETDIGENIINTKQTLELNPFINIYYEAEGIGVFKGYTDTYGYLSCQFMENSHWNNKYRLTIDSAGLSIREKSIGEKNAEVIINNEIANFQNSGLLIRTYNEILDKYEDKEITLALNKGENIYNYELKTDILGNVEQEIIPYIIIKDKKIYGSTSLTLKYYVDEIGNVDEIGKIEETNLLKITLIISGVIFIGLVYFFIRRKK